MATINNPAIVTLKESDNPTVVLQDHKYDISAKTVSELIRACRMYDQAGEVQEQFKELVDYLVDWLKEQDVAYASIAIRSEGLLFVVVQREVEFNEELSDSLTELDCNVASDSRFNLLRLNTLALPKCSKEDVVQFFDLSKGEHA